MAHFLAHTFRDQPQLTTCYVEIEGQEGLTMLSMFHTNVLLLDTVEWGEMRQRTSTDFPP